ncbi:MAG: hypothetical protein VX341_09085 [Bdellovibrionota bacterium]|nr:hypothetical protein [Bdellovibrionota bacterium]
MKILILFLSLNIFANTEKPFILAYNENSESQSIYVKKALDFTKRLYRLAGINFKVIALPPKRSLLYLKTGQIDVDLIRVDVVANQLAKANKEYGILKYPFHDEISIVSTNKNIEQFNTLDEFRDSNKKIIALRGTELVELFLKKENIIYVTKQSQGPEMLIRGRNEYLLTGRSTKAIVDNVFKESGKDVYWGPKNRKIVQLVQIHGERAKREILPKLNALMKKLKDNQNEYPATTTPPPSAGITANW